MQPNAIPIELARSHVILTTDMIYGLFGEDFRIRGSECVEVLWGRREAGLADVVVGDAPALFLDAGTRSALSSKPVKVRGPKGLLPAPSIQPIPTTLALPEGLMDAWNLSVDQKTTVLLGDAAVRATVVLGASPHLRVDRTLCFAGGLDLNADARWAPDLTWNAPGIAESSPEATPRPLRVITENDVRRARMLRKQIQIQEGQIVTPAARELAIQFGVLDES